MRSSLRNIATAYITRRDAGESDESLEWFLNTECKEYPDYRHARNTVQHYIDTHQRISAIPVSTNPVDGLRDAIKGKK